MVKRYSDEFKLSVIKDYYSSTLGVRAIALKYGLPSKNYIGKWEKELIDKGLLPKESTKPNKSAGRSSEAIMRKDTRTEKEKELEEEIRVLKAKVAYYEGLKSLQPYLKKKREKKYEVIMSLELDYPVQLLCEIAGISRSSYYKYKNKPVSKDTAIDKIIIDIYNKTNKRAGYRTIKFILRNRYGLIVNHKKIQRIMRENNIQSIIRKKRKKCSEKSIIKENILNRDFRATRPGEKYVTDITYIPTQRKMIYLCTAIDLYNNEPVAWNISDTADKSLSLNTIKSLSRKVDLRNSIIHSDQGVHYTNKSYAELLERLQVKQSMSRKGNCWDNAKAESFFSNYKCETIKLMRKKIKDINDVKQITNEYMDYYINYRPQKALGGLSPSAYRIKNI
jgi:putative transposase